MVQNNQKLRRMNIPRMSAGEDPVKYAETLRKLVQDEFNRLSSDFYAFRQDTINAAVIPLKPVSMITAIADQYSVDVTWENPQQDTITPTHVRIRIPEAFDTWAEYSYPRNTWEFSGLLPGTPYTVEIQLIARYEDSISYVSAMRNCPSLPVQRVAESEVRARTFTTAAGVGPPEQGTGNTTTFPFPETEGTAGSPGSGDCWWEYIFQAFDESLTGGTWVDTIYTDEFDGDVDLIDFDQTLLDCSVVHRIRYREVCNSVPEAWVDGSPFMPACDWADPCGGISASDTDTEAPFTSADIFLIPKVCVRDGQNLTIEDGVSGVELSLMAEGYDTIYLTDNWTFRGKNAGSFQQPLFQADLPLVGDLTGQSDFTVSIALRLAATAGIGTSIVLFLGTKFRISVTQVPGGWTASMIAPFEGGGIMNLASTVVIPINQWSLVTAVVNAAGEKSLWVDGVKVAATVNDIELDLAGMTTDIAAFTLDDMEMKTIAGWNRALSDAEIPVLGLEPRTVEPTHVSSGHIATTDSASGTLTIPGSDLAGDRVLVVMLETQGAADIRTTQSVFGGTALVMPTLSDTDRPSIPSVYAAWHLTTPSNVYVAPYSGLYGTQLSAANTSWALVTLRDADPPVLIDVGEFGITPGWVRSSGVYAQFPDHEVPDGYTFYYFVMTANDYTVDPTWTNATLRVNGENVNAYDSSASVAYVTGPATPTGIRCNAAIITNSYPCIGFIVAAPGIV